jgi:Flp pilus assembly protein TadD
MSIKTRALIAAFLVSAVSAPTIATAQQKPATVSVSKEAAPKLQALEKAVKENRTAEIPALSAAALAVAKTPSDRYFAYRLQLPSLVAAKNNEALLTAIEGVLATGVATGDELANLTLLSAKLGFNKGATDPAAAASAATRAQQAVQLNPNDGEAHYILGLNQNRQKRAAEAVASLQKAQTLWAAAGKPYDPQVADQLFAIAYGAKLPVARDLAMAQLKAAPSAKTWRTAIKLTEQTSNLPAPDKVDLFRLQRATASFEGEGDYYPYIDALLTRGLPGEAKAVLDEAFASGKLDRNKAAWKEMQSAAAARVAADRASLAAGEKAALAAATARPALATGDAFLSYGDYAKAATLYRAALGKSGVDADLANLRLGIALARSGDKAGAQTALNAVKGTRSGTAQLWLMYLQRSA